jgi:hypothetical protein
VKLILKDGAVRANARANETMKLVREAVGID